MTLAWTRWFTVAARGFPSLFLRLKSRDRLAREHRSLHPRRYRGLRSVALLACVVPALVLLSDHRVLAAFSVIFDGVVKVVNTGGTSLTGPVAVAADNAGNLYIVDTGDNQIVKVTAAGAASVLAITGLSPALSGPQGSPSTHRAICTSPTRATTAL